MQSERERLEQAARDLGRLLDAIERGESDEDYGNVAEELGFINECLDEC